MNFFYIIAGKENTYDDESDDDSADAWKLEVTGDEWKHDPTEILNNLNDWIPLGLTTDLERGYITKFYNIQNAKRCIKHNFPDLELHNTVIFKVNDKFPLYYGINLTENTVKINKKYIISVEFFWPEGEAPSGIELEEIITEKKFMKKSQLKTLIKEIIKQSLALKKNVSEGYPPSTDHMRIKKEIYTLLTKSGFRSEGTQPKNYVEYYLNGFATVFCSIDLDNDRVLIQRYYDSERLDTMKGNHVELSIPLPEIYSADFVQGVVAKCLKLQKSIRGDESIFGGMDDVE